MIFEKFKIIAVPKFIDAYCNCGKDLKVIDDGWFSEAFFCPKCHSVYKLKLIKMADKKVNKKYLKELIKKHGEK